ncbi:MAG: PA14 domain-containing protein [Sulfurovaceae bacterium]
MSRIFLRIFVFIGLIFTFQSYADGLTGKYYNNDDFTDLKLTRVDPTINFDWGNGSPDASINGNTFSVEWTGLIYIPEDGNYRFYLAHDDEIVLTIDGVERYSSSNWTGNPNSYGNTSQIHFKTGYYPITIRYKEGWGGAYAKFAWRNNKSITSPRIVPASNLFTVPAPTPPSDFNLRYKANLMGNMKVIGNTVLCPRNWRGQCITNTSQRNDAVNLRYVDIDSDATTFNSSSATFEDSAISPDSDNPQPARIVWAGLYWSGYLHTYEAADGTQSQFTNLTSNTNTVTNAINNHTIQFRAGNDTYNIVNNNGDKVLGFSQFVNFTQYKSFNYACFADVTNLLKDKDPVTTYSVANVPSMEGQTNRGSIGDGLGNSGAWSLVIIYENTSVGEKTRNVSVFDGFSVIDGSNSRTITVNGFLTPSSGSVDSTLSVFANEGDQNIAGDRFILTNLDGDNAGQNVTLKNATNAINNFFDSSITGVPTRTPNLVNNQGIDIHTEQMGEDGYNIMANNQTAVSIQFTTTGDVYYPSMVAFATELYRPELCYDFAGLIGDNITVPIDSNRTFSISKWGDTDPFYIKAFIRSEEADFNLVNTSMKIIMKENNGSVMSGKLAFDLAKTEVSPNSINGYLPAIGITGESDMFSIGENNSVTGGTIGVSENTYAKAAFDFLTGNTIDGKFNLELHTSLQLNPGDPNDLTSYVYSTANGSLPLCARDYVYDPIWLYFNVERAGSNTASTPVDKYSLLTQMVGRTFDIDVVSYSGAPSYTTEQTINNIAVDLELINAGGFENNSSAGYDSVCNDSGNAVTDGQFVVFNNKSRVSINDFISDTALESAAFRVWVLTKTEEDGTSTIVNHTCASAIDESCFQTVYLDNYYDANATSSNYCDTACGSTPSGCYECLKKYYATPVCSRDNFSIRPEGFRVRIYDNNESNLTSPTPKEIIANNIENNATLAAGYKYLLELKALAYSDDVNDETTALGYYNENFRATNNINVPTKDAIALEFNDNAGKCNDKNTTTYKYIFQNGIIDNLKGTNLRFSFDNAGQYKFWIDDSNWTRVDQKDYEYKTTFNGVKNDDCIIDNPTSPGSGKVGCNTRSYINGNTRFYELPLQFYPYAFDLSTINMTNSPDNANTSWLFTNNLSEDPHMGARFYGNVIAIAKNDTQTTNFVNGCAATDVNLDLNISSTPEEGNITALDKDSNIALISSNNIIIGADSNITDANGTQATIVKEYFTKDNSGSSVIDLRYNYDRFNNMVTNPIVATFHTLIASAPDANASVEMDDNKTPDGEQNYDRNITFLKGRVYTELETFNSSDGYDLEDDNINIIFTALAYCEDTVDINCTDTMRTLNGDPTLTGEITNWYPMTSHIDTYDANSINDGKILQLNDEDGAGVTMSSATNIEFDNGAKTSNINIAEGTAEDSAKIRVSPDFWLKYPENSSENGNPYFILNFDKLSDEWTGVGNTGHKIDINASKGSMDRTTW